MAVPHQHSIVQQDAAPEEHPWIGRIQHRVTKMPPAGPQGQGVLQFYLTGRGHGSLLLSARVFVVRRRLSFQTTNAFRVHEQNGDTSVGFANGTAYLVRLGPFGQAVEKAGKLKVSSGLAPSPPSRTRAWLKVWLVS